MLQAFIVRPFGVKDGIDFDKVETDLLQPALKAVGIIGSTTGVIVEAGNIREDMFSLLLTADLVIADLSVHNANVFYELGIRHALRDKKTFLIRCSKDEIPFDLKTDRYMTYPAHSPAECLQNLISGLTAILLSERQDSPVFYMLPKLEAQNPERFLAVPADFGEEVDLAQANRHLGRLAMLSGEAEGFAWEIPALRLIGQVQFALKAYDDAQQTWNKVKDRYPDDLEANDRLATIYQQLAEEEINAGTGDGADYLAQSDLAIKKLLTKHARLERAKRAETYSLKGRNAKTRWINSWKGSDAKDRIAHALQSPYLYDAFRDYERAYNEDLNHFYSGINALGLLTVIITLAQDLGPVWELEFDTKEEADEALDDYKEQHQKLTIMVSASIDSEDKRLKREDKTDPWLEITEADLRCLTLQRPERIKNLYSKVVKYATGFNFEAAEQQLRIYEQLNVLPDNVQAALGAFADVPSSLIEKKRHYLLFTGHMIDSPDRPEPRFPEELAPLVKEKIRQAVQEEKDKIEGSMQGIAGGACGGDILFHEVCLELGIESMLYLALPRELFIAESVQDAGPEWIERFDHLYTRLDKRVLAKTKALPKWLQKKGTYSIWERNNAWMLNSALANSGLHMTMIALWDGKSGDGPGGTQHMVNRARERGAKIVIIDIKELRAEYNKQGVQ
ncbi:MAG: hypothetical protein INR73_27170 [Williamsia sp.]|nr:hypothetical protein [Williamsia sp.]